MGTHPIFESDFDCLTVMKLFVVGRVTNRAVQRNYHQIPINYGLADWWGVAGKSKPANQIEKPDHTKRADCQFKGKYAVYPEDVKVPAGLEPHQFNVIDADAPPSSEMGAMVQYESVVNSKDIPSWYKNFNAWKFRQDWPSGNATRLGCLVDDQINILDERIDAMRDECTTSSVKISSTVTSALKWRRRAKTHCRTSNGRQFPPITAIQIRLVGNTWPKWTKHTCSTK